MHGFITLYKVVDGSPITIAIHAIGAFAPVEGAEDESTNVTLSFGKSGRQDVIVGQAHNTIKRLIKEAQEPLPSAK
jgi:hypothetical protein